MENSNGKDLIVINRPTGPRVFPETGGFRKFSRFRRSVRFAASFLIPRARSVVLLLKRPQLGAVDYIAIATAIEFIPKVVRNFV